MALKVIRITLYLILWVTGSQCSSLRMGVICSRFDSLDTRRAAEFWMRWSLATSLFGMLIRRQLQLSSTELTNECTRISVVCLSRRCRIFPILWRASEAWRHIILTWCRRDRCLSKTTPRSRTVGLLEISAFPIWMGGNSCTRFKGEETCSSSV